MGIVILKWNPAFSSYTMVRFLNHLEKCALANDGSIGMNWSVWEYGKVHKGDTCFLLKVGYGQTGIVARGVITSEPYSGEDWSWRNRPTMYCDFDFEVMINPDAFPLLTSAELSEAIPEFDWFGGHSGMVLTEGQGEKLEQLWQNYMQRQAADFEKASDQNLFLLSGSVSPIGAPYTLQREDSYSGPKIILEKEEGDLHTRLNIYNYHRVLGKFGVRSWRALQQLLFQRYPTAEALPNLCADLFQAEVDFHVSFFQTAEEEEEEEEE